MDDTAVAPQQAASEPAGIDQQAPARRAGIEPAGSDQTGTGEQSRVEQLDSVVIRFAGDSGDGMQLTGDRFTAETAGLGNDLATLPNFPAEIRAPQGTLPGVSSFQLHFADHDVLTPGDAPDILVAMNPAALKANLGDLARGTTLILNTDEFTKRNLSKVGYAVSPLTDGSLDSYRVHAVPLTSLTVEALKDFGLSRKDAERAKNMFALGLLCWLYHRPTEGTERFLSAKFGRKPEILPRTWPRSRPAGRSARPPRRSPSPIRWRPRRPDRPVPERHRQRRAGLRAGGRGARAQLRLVLGSYPITPASDILHALSGLKRFGITTIQAEDEISAIGAALGAAYGGAIGVTTTSGPGLALKSETIGLAVSLELPLVIVDVQRGGPSTRAAHQDRAVRPAAGHVRAQRRVAGAGDRAALPRRLLRRRDRGGPGGHHLPDTGAAALGRLPGQRVRAVEAARGRVAAGPAGRLRRHPRARCPRVPALRPRSGHAGPAVGDPRHPGPGAPDRRDREGRRHRGDLLRPGQPRPDGPAAGGEGGRDRRPRSRGRRPDR